MTSAPSSGCPPSQALLSRHHVLQLYCTLFSFIKYTVLQPSLCTLANFLLTGSLITDILPVADSFAFSLACMSDYTPQSVFLKVTILTAYLQGMLDAAYLLLECHWLIPELDHSCWYAGDKKVCVAQSDTGRCSCRQSPQGEAARTNRWGLNGEMNESEI